MSGEPAHKEALPATKSLKPPSREDLTIMHLSKVIIHDVPRRSKEPGQKPILSDVECEIDPETTQLLRTKITNALNSSHRFELQKP